MTAVPPVRFVWIRASMACAAAMTAAVMVPAIAAEGPHMESGSGSTSGPARRCCPVVELRQYTMKPGGRDTLARLFDAHFIESQEEYGTTMVGQFHDLAKPDRFVWIRGFDDMDARTRAMDFYKGPVWKQHSKAANATMIDVSNVLLLKPAGEDTGFAFDRAARPRPSASDGAGPGASTGTAGTTGAASGGGVVVATIHYASDPLDPTFAAWFRSDVVPVLGAAGTKVLAQFVTEPAPNPVKTLPVREGEHVFVWFAAYPDAQAADAAWRGITQRPEWSGRIAPKLRAMTTGDPERLVLAPTSRSWLRH